MSKKNFRIMIADVPDKEEPVCEIYYKNSGWVQISAETPDEFVIAFCNKENGEYWEFPYDEAMEVLQEAKEHLVKLQRTPEEQARYEARMEAQRKKWYGDENTQ